MPCGGCAPTPDLRRILPTDGDGYRHPRRLGWLAQPRAVQPSPAGKGHEAVRTFLTGSSAPSARPRCARRGPALRACGAGAPVPTRTPPCSHEDAEGAPRHLARCPRQLQAGTNRRNPAHRRAADPIANHLHDAARHQGRTALLRDGLRPPLTPDTAEQEGWLSGRWLFHARTGHRNDLGWGRASRPR